MKRYFITSFWCRTKFGTEKTILSSTCITIDNRMPTLDNLFKKFTEVNNSVQVISLVSISELSESDFNTFINNN